MINMKALKRDILEYKRTKDPKMFASIICSVDYLIAYFIKKCKVRLPYLHRMEFEDLYHTSIIALHKAITTFPNSMTEAYIPCRLRAYMLAEFNKTYRYLRVEIALNNLSPFRNTPGSTMATIDNKDYVNVDKIDYDLVLDSLTIEEAKLLSNYLDKSKQSQVIAREMKMSNATISLKIKSIISRFRDEKTNSK